MDLRSLLDDALEISVMASWTRLGYRLRRRLFGWSDAAPGALVGRTALVTGSTSGLGRTVAEELAGLGARVILLSRSEEKLATVRRELMAAYGEDRFPAYAVDMSSLEAVRFAAARILSTEDHLDILVDNAGAIHAQRRLTPEGLEATLATMVVGPFLLISRLLPLLRRSSDARVVCVASGGMYLQRLDLDDLGWDRGSYEGTRAYARAKRAQTALAREWARRVGGAVRVNAMHPGWADTPGLAEQLPGFYEPMRPLLRTPTEGADTIIWLATAADAGVGGGGLYLDRRRRPFDRIPQTRLDAADRRRLWDAVVELSGELDPAPCD